MGLRARVLGFDGFVVYVSLRNVHIICLRQVSASCSQSKLHVVRPLCTVFLPERIISLWWPQVSAKSVWTIFRSRSAAQFFSIPHVDTAVSGPQVMFGGCSPVQG